MVLLKLDCVTYYFGIIERNKYSNNLILNLYSIINSKWFFVLILYLLNEVHLVSGDYLVLNSAYIHEKIPVLKNPWNFLVELFLPKATFLKQEWWRMISGLFVPSACSVRRWEEFTHSQINQFQVLHLGLCYLVTSWWESNDSCWSLFTRRCTINHLSWKWSSFYWDQSYNKSIE